MPDFWNFCIPDVVFHHEPNDAQRTAVWEGVAPMIAFE